MYIHLVVWELVFFLPFCRFLIPSLLANMANDDEPVDGENPRSFTASMYASVLISIIRLRVERQSKEIPFTLTHTIIALNLTSIFIICRITRWQKRWTWFQCTTIGSKWRPSSSTQTKLSPKLRTQACMATVPS